MLRTSYEDHCKAGMDVVPPGADLEASVPPEAVLENPKQWELEGEATDIVCRQGRTLRRQCRQGRSWKI